MKTQILFCSVTSKNGLRTQNCKHDNINNFLNENSQSLTKKSEKKIPNVKYPFIEPGD